MAFESLSAKLDAAFKKLRGKGKLTETDVNEAMREVRMALLEADVNYKVAKNFIKDVTERAVGEDVMKSLSPAQMVIKIVNEEMTKLMGNNPSTITSAGRGPTVILMAGLQGSGKTTSAAKLAKYFLKKDRRPMLCACDIYRPAAITQLQVLGESIGVPVFSMGDKVSPVEIAKAAYKEAEIKARDILIIDTAGRLQIDEEMMDEIKDIALTIKPQEILLVVDAMTGQDAVKVTETFDAALEITGVILTKLDGDTRGGAALSVKAVTGKPIKFVGMGEKTDALEQFFPDRMASRILGMGDVLTLIEKAQETVDLEKAQDLEQKLRKNQFTLDDFLEQMDQLKNMGPLDDLLNMIPGMGKVKGIKDVKIDEKDMAHTRAIITSMTPYERRNPHLINGSRRKRIANGAGVTVTDVNRLLKQFENTQQMMKRFNKLSNSKAMKRGFNGMRFPF